MTDAAGAARRGRAGPTRSAATRAARRPAPPGGRTLGVALLGCGTVGAEVVRLLAAHGAELADRVGARLELRGVAVRRPAKLRQLPVDPALFTTDALGLIRRADVDVVVEVIGGFSPARELLLAAFAAGRSVVTANKALLAEDGALLHDSAAAHGAQLYFEASVAGAIPLLRPLRESLAGDRIQRVVGIVNGTTNFVLTRMDETGAGFAEALDDATALGYAEADPSSDIDGYDSAAKAAILAGLAFHTRVTAADVHREGIGTISAADIASARAIGCTLKLLAIAERTPGGIGVRVHPALVSRAHPLAGVREAFNAVLVEAEAAGPLMFYGRGAGGAPTASAVLGDLVAVGRHLVSGTRGPGESAYAQLAIRPIGEALTRYHVCLDVADKAGVLASVAAAFAAHDVSIQTVHQSGRGDDATLVLVTHTAAEAALAATVADLRRLDTVRAVTSVLRVEGELG